MHCVTPMMTGSHLSFERKRLAGGSQPVGAILIESRPMKIAVFGAGGIGGYFGARLAAGGGEVHLIARGAHLEALRSGGVRITSANGDLHLELPATDRPEDIGGSDVVLFCVKSMDTLEAARRLEPLLREGTAVITLQNGVDNEETIASVIPSTHVVGGVAYILATVTGPGVVTHQGKLARIVLGELDGSKSARLEAFVDLCHASDIDVDLTANIRKELWKKFAVICATAGMTAAVRLPLGDIRASEASLAMYRELVSEVVSVANASGMEMAGDTVARIMEVFETLPAEWYSSLHYDMTHGKPMELEALHGTVKRRARELGVSVPMSEAVYGVLAPWATLNLERK